MADTTVGAAIVAAIAALSAADKLNHSKVMDAMGDAVSGFMCPIGGIIAWHKTMTGVPALSDQFLECDGSVISDGDSPMDGETLPDLNGDARFLRGAAASGAEEADAYQGHHHEILRQDAAAYPVADANDDAAGSGQAGVVYTGSVLTTRFQAKTNITDGSNGTPRTATETRPINMSVVWIMRIK